MENRSSLQVQAGETCLQTQPTELPLSPPLFPATFPDPQLSGLFIPSRRLRPPAFASPLQTLPFASGGNKPPRGKPLVHQAGFLIDGLPAGVSGATVNPCFFIVAAVYPE